MVVLEVQMMKYRNKTTGKIVEVVREEESYVWVKMDGIVNPLAKVRFLKVYEKIRSK